MNYSSSSDSDWEEELEEIRPIPTEMAVFLNPPKR